MNRPSFPRKPALLVTALAAILLAGCATHYPYSGGNGVYYGKGYGGHGHKQPYYGYGHTSYRYNYYRYDYRHNYRPWWYGYGSYYGGHHDRGHDRGHDRDRHHDHDTAGRSGDAADELRRVTGQQQRRALLQRDEPGTVHRIKQESPASNPSPSSTPRTSTGSARDQLRQSRPSSSGARPSSGSGSARVESRRAGGIRTPEKRQR